MTQPRFSIIVAHAQNRAMGIDNRMPWHLPADLQYFKQVTLGHAMIMGRRTFDSIGRVLPGRTSVVVTRQPGWSAPGCLTAASIDAAIAACGDAGEIFFIGGADLFRQVLPRVSRLYLTEIQATFAADTFFPEIDMGGWREVSREIHAADTANPWPWHFAVYDRI